MISDDNEERQAEKLNKGTVNSVFTQATRHFVYFDILKGIVHGETIDFRFQNSGFSSCETHSNVFLTIAREIFKNAEKQEFT